MNTSNLPCQSSEGQRFSARAFSAAPRDQIWNDALTSAQMPQAEGEMTWKGCHPRDRMLGSMPKPDEDAVTDKNGRHEAQLPKVDEREFAQGCSTSNSHDYWLKICPRASRCGVKLNRKDGRRKMGDADQTKREILTIGRKYNSPVSLAGVFE